MRVRSQGLFTWLQNFPWSSELLQGGSKPTGGTARPVLVAPYSVTGLLFFRQAAHLQRLVLMPLSALLSLFTGPQKLIQKRYDKLLDCNSSLPRVAGDETDLAKKEYEALNAQLVEELQVFNQAARKILWNCLCSFMALLRDLTLAAQQVYSTVAPVSSAPAPGWRGQQHLREATAL